MAAIVTSRPLSHHLAAAPFRALGEMLVRMAEASPDTRSLNLLNATSDEELLARGTTRNAEIRRILGSRFYL